MCDRCGVDKTVTLETTIKLDHIDPRSGRESVKTRATRLCVGCAGTEDNDATPRWAA